MKRAEKMVAVMLTAVLLGGTPGFGAPVIVHEPVSVAPKGQPLGIRATVRDTAAPVESVSLLYAASRGMTPFRVAMTSTGAGIWYGTIPGHMIGPGNQLLYYLQAENADGETAETEWFTVKVVETGVAPEAIPSATAVAQKSQQEAVPATVAPTPPPTPPPPRTGKGRYLVPAAVIVGGAVAVGGALAIVNHNEGGGGGGPTENLDGNYGGNYSLCFEPTAATTNPASTVCNSGLINIYVRQGQVEVVGLWEASIFTALLGGRRVFSATKDVPATAKFPAARLILTGEFAGSTCVVRVDGYSTDPAQPGNFNGQINTTKR